MEQDRNRICQIISTIMTEKGSKKDIVKGVDLFRVDQSSQRSQMNYQPSVIIIVQGQKRAYIGEKPIVYDPMNYLVLSVAMPIECDTITPAGEPLLGIRLAVDTAMVSEIAMTLDSLPPAEKSVPLGIYSAAMDNIMINAVCRLMETLQTPLESKFLAPIYIKEILFRVLCNDDGSALRMLAYRNQGYYKIVRLIEKIHTDYERKYDVDSLAREADMSVSSFHSAFKAITSLSPLQYIKKEKLHKARELIMQEGLTANLAAYRVGYESPSQFSREYKRMFGVTPGRDVTSGNFRSLI